MTRALVLSGGGNLGAAQAGMLVALEDAGIRPDLIVGTSVGAFNGAWIAGGRSAGELAQLWRTLRRRDVYPIDLIGGFLGFVGLRDHLVSDGPLRRLLTQYVTFERMEDAPIPFHVVATDVLTGHDLLLNRGSAVDAVLASAAIPGIFPPVTVDGVELMDGGIANNTPISQAVALGADELWVLSTGHACGLTAPPKTALAMMLHAFSVAIEERLNLDIAEYAETVDLKVAPPLCPVNVLPTDFSQSGHLIDDARRQTEAWLQQQHLALASDRGHRHQ
ncbi:hypothetical patatin-like protein [Nocardioides baekrokdamisoli]|uniref:Hypothetical patatin-like protein n=1 Tax=Nocardioides baekrokdamisoli TaxID=1804624 RepID=A0A3G9J5M6_9ACTN|nr:patatin-like phospholipase family protein [Nocardioides baekrokdamisoli]BBH18634.1 hypothetical patatin-like protein [Nocardioides baekrokdamisoli]